MIILLSPSKTLDFETKPYTKKYTQPELLEHSEKLIKELRKLSPDQLMEMMKISENLADLNHQRYRDFTTPFTTKNAKQAILTFDGDVYRDLEIDKYTEKQFEFAQKHVRTLSGLYGLLKPLDLIQPYRLEMKYRSDYWKDILTDKLNEHIKNEGSKEVLNLASQEYFKPIQTKKLDAKVFTPVFKEKKSGKYQIIAIYAKIARGTMTNFIIKNSISDIKKLKDFSEDNYKFSPEMSTEKTLAFTRG